MDNCCSDERTQASYRYDFQSNFVGVLWICGCNVVLRDNLKNYSSARWWHHSLPGCNLGLVRERLLSGCWVGFFSSTSSSFSSLCSREATHRPSFSELLIPLQSRICHFWLNFNMVPSSCRWTLFTSSSLSSGRLFDLPPYLCCEGFSNGAFLALAGWKRAKETVKGGCRDTSRWTLYSVWQLKGMEQSRHMFYAFMKLWWTVVDIHVSCSHAHIWITGRKVLHVEVDWIWEKRVEVRRRAKFKLGQEMKMVMRRHADTWDHAPSTLQ